jgi:hypothetical protein
MNWADFLAEIREEINDTGSTKRYSDGTLWRYTRDAILDYSSWFPMRVDGVVLTPDPISAKKCALPADFIDEVSVECPEGTFLERRQSQPGVRYVQSSTLMFYTKDAGAIYLNADPGDNDVVLAYYATHTIPPKPVEPTDPPTPPEEGEEEWEFTVPDVDLELIRMYVVGRVLTYIRTQQSRLDRFKVSSGARDDNPVEPETTDYMLDYDKGIAERRSGGGVRLYKPSRYRK